MTINVRDRQINLSDEAIATLQDFCHRVPREVLGRSSKPPKSIWTGIKDFFKYL